MKIARGESLALFAIMSIAVAARVLNLNAGLWYDEVYTLTHYVREPLNQLIGDFSSLNNHMFYSLQAKAAVFLFGESNWVLRLPAVIFGLGSIVVLWATSRAYAGRTVALFAALLLAISYHHVWFSQNARGYTGMLFWTSLATLFFVAGLRQSGLRHWIGYALCLALGIYTHLSAGFFFASHAVVYAVAWLNRRSAKMARYEGLGGLGPVFGFALGAILTLILHIPLLTQILTTVNKVSRSSSGSSMAEWADPFRALREIMFSMGELGVLAPVVLSAGLVLTIAGAVQLWRKDPLLVGIYLLSIPLTLAILLALHFRIWPRYFFLDIGFVMLCATAGVNFVCALIGGKLHRPAVGRALFSVSVVIASVTSIVLLARNYAHPKQDFTGALALIEAKSMPGDVTTSFGLAVEPMQAYFAPHWPVVRTEGDLARIASSRHCIWLVTAFDDRARPEQRPLLDQIKRDFTAYKVFEGTLGGGTVRVYRKGATCPK